MDEKGQNTARAFRAMTAAIDFLTQQLKEEQERSAQLEEEIAKLNAELELRLIDELTGAYTRRWLRVQGEKINIDVRHVAYVDVDGMKKLNDEQSHAVGDSVLAQLGTALSPAGRVVRLGGDEFLVLIYEASPEPVLSGILSRVERIVPAIKVSIGCASFDGNLSAAIHGADCAMYRVKKYHRQH